jgi:peptide/nickel transport system permease protein
VLSRSKRLEELAVEGDEPTFGSEGQLAKALGGIRPRTFLEAYGIVVIILMTAAILAAPLLAGDPIDQDLSVALTNPTADHWLGTDNLGRDIWARILYGGRNSLLIGVFVILIAGTIGIVYGAISGFVGGVVDGIMMRVVDIFLSFPAIMLALLISAALGPKIRTVIIAIAVAWWPFYARLIRGQVIVIKQREYVTASRALGAGPMRNLFMTVLPNSFGVMKTILILDIGYAILAGSTLSFLGLGVSLPTPEWGVMIREALQFPNAWWMVLSPGIALLLFVSAMNFAGGVATRSVHETHSR